MKAPRFLTSEAHVCSKVAAIHARLADSQRIIAQLMNNAAALPWGFIEQYERAADLADEAAAYAARLAIAKVQV